MNQQQQNNHQERTVTNALGWLGQNSFIGHLFTLDSVAVKK